jgi:hypothetical protein
MKYDPYGVNEHERQIGDKLHRLYQGETLVLYFILPSHITTFSPETLKFTIVDQRFVTEILFSADTDNFEEVDTPEEVIKVKLTVPSDVTRYFRRGSFLYSMEYRAILGEERIVIEEGSLLVEYQAGAPDPDIPYKTYIATDETQNG